MSVKPHLSWFETTLNYWIMVERYPNLKEEVGDLIPDCETSSLIDYEINDGHRRSFSVICANLELALHAV